MKTLPYFFLLLFLAFSTAGFGQNILYQQDFETGLSDVKVYDVDQEELENIDPSLGVWQTMSDYNDNQVAAVSAFGVSPEDWLVLPKITITNPNTFLQFKVRNEVNAWFTMGLDVWVSTTGDDDPEKFDDEFRTIDNDQIGTTWQTYTYPLEEFVGQEINLGLKNSRTNSYLLKLDDILIFESAENDVAIEKFDPITHMQTARKGMREVTVDFVNLGSETLTTVNLELELNGQVIHQETLTGLDLLPLRDKRIVIPDIDFQVGNDQTIICRISNWNGEMGTSVSQQIPFEVWEDFRDLTFSDNNGQSHTLSTDLQNGPVVFDFFAHWCGPCRQEIDDLNRLANETNTEVYAIAISNFGPDDTYQGSDGPPQGPFSSFKYDLFRYYNHYAANYFESGASVPYHVIFCAENGDYTITEHRGSMMTEQWKTLLADCSSFVNTPTSTTEPALAAAIELFPNPSYDQVQINWDHQVVQVKQINLFDAQGKRIQQFKQNLIEGQIDYRFESLSPGLYLFQFQLQDGQSLSREFVVLPR